MKWGIQKGYRRLYVLLLPELQSVARNEDEENRETGDEDGGNKEHTDGSLDEELLDIRFPHPNRLERCRLRPAEHDEERVQFVLV